MNIDIVNKQVSLKLGVKEDDVAMVNKFFWKKAKEHIGSYNSNPFNIQNVCVIYPDKYKVKGQIIAHIAMIRNIMVSKKYSENSGNRDAAIGRLKVELKRIWDIRKKYKWTN